MTRVVLPSHLRALARVTGEVEVEGSTPAEVLGELEQRYPALRGTMRDAATGRRRAYVRFFACREDLSHDPMDALLPEVVRRGEEPLLVVGAMAGG